MTMWRLTWELDLTTDDHAALATLLAAAFTGADLGGRSWHSERPEARIVGYDDDDGGRPVAHLAFLRRFVRVGGGAVLVADCGLVCVDPTLQGQGLGRALLQETARVLADVGVPFGFLTTGADRAGYYASGGWQLTPTQRTLTIEHDESVQDWREASMVLPLHGGEFPAGLIVRDGYEV